MIISKDAEKAFDKLKYPLVVKITQHSRNRRKRTQSDKKKKKKNNSETHTHKLIANVLNGERLNTLPIRAERG